MNSNKVYHGNCLDVLKTFPDNCIDSCVTDPPYGISFMNKHWDYQIPSVQIWEQVLRVLKPGGHLFCACGTRTQHRMAVNIEDAGFEIRDVITWHYGSGFPKSLDIAKAIDKAAGAEREVVGISKYAERRPNVIPGEVMQTGLGSNHSITAPATEAAKQWEGWGTALKPATEFWTLARKPISENTISENVLMHGTGGLNIDGCRIEVSENDPNHRENWEAHSREKKGYINFVGNERKPETLTKGRFPANVIFDEFTGKILDEQSGELTSGNMKSTYLQKESENNSMSGKNYERFMPDREGDSGGASRFFYCPKADNFERNKGLKGFEKWTWKDHGYRDNESSHLSPRAGAGRTSVNANHHPTVKPIYLMRYLVKLITPKHGICIDPFCGSGTTLIGCKMELINFIGIDLNEEYCKIAEARVAAWNPEKYIEQTLF